MIYQSRTYNPTEIMLMIRLMTHKDSHKPKTGVYNKFVFTGSSKFDFNTDLDDFDSLFNTNKDSDKINNDFNFESINKMLENFKPKTDA